MPDRYFRAQVEGLEPRASLASLGLRPTPQAVVGAIQGTETIKAQGYQLQGSGTVTPLGDVSVTGFFGGGRGALNDRGSLTFSNANSRMTLSVSTHGYFPTQYAEAIRMTVQVRSATGSSAGIHVQGTINLVNPIIPHHFGVIPTVPFAAQINLRP